MLLCMHALVQSRTVYGPEGLQFTKPQGFRGFVCLAGTLMHLTIANYHVAMLYTVAITTPFVSRWYIFE
jgi:hypothetical protein